MKQHIAGIIKRHLNTQARLSRCLDTDIYPNYIHSGVIRNGMTANAMFMKRIKPFCFSEGVVHTTRDRHTPSMSHVQRLQTKLFCYTEDQAVKIGESKNDHF